MTWIPPETPCVLFALERESQAFCRSLRLSSPIPGAPCRARLFNSLLVLETGVGVPRTRRALDWLFSQPSRPRSLVSAGFCGALQEELKIGEVVMATEVIDGNGGGWLPSWSPPVAGTWRRGRLLTTPHMVGDPHRKQALGQTHQALAVDMESAEFARRCSLENIPFACVRAVSDEIDTSLSPRLLGLLAGGRVSPWRLTTALLRQPGLLPELLRLARHTSLAANKLALVLTALLAGIGERRA